MRTLHGRLTGAIVAAGLAGLILTVATPAPAAAQTRTITCESQGGRQFCRVGSEGQLDQGSVGVERRLGDRSCNRGPDWGTTDNGIWVDRGCRAVFRYTLRGGAAQLPGAGPQRVTCESSNSQRRTCFIADNLQQDRVRLERQLSSSACVNGRDWGTTGSGVWVSNGCRAVFMYEPRSGGWPGGGGGAGRARTITCESVDDRRNQCALAEGADASTVRVDNQLSRNDCIKDRSWGMTGTTLWVANGCRAVFRYEVVSREVRVTCESLDNRRQECPMGRDLDRDRIRLDRMLGGARCQRGFDWGTTSTSVWVQNGCRAQFIYDR